MAGLTLRAAFPVFTVMATPSVQGHQHDPPKLPMNRLVSASLYSLAKDGHSLVCLPCVHRQVTIRPRAGRRFIPPIG
jgi:hypothetical protein